MNYFSKIFIVLFFLGAFGVLSYFSFPIIKERYFQDEKNEKTLPSIQAENQPPMESSDPDTDSEIINQTPIPKFDQSAKNSLDGKSFIEISREECESDCASFAENLPNFSYCQQVCGLSSTPPTAPKEDCEGLESLDRDYCLKNLATKKGDFDICDKIKDENIKTTCISRITEDIVDKQTIDLAP